MIAVGIGKMPAGAKERDEFQALSARLDRLESIVAELRQEEPNVTPFRRGRSKKSEE